MVSSESFRLSQQVLKEFVDNDMNIVWPTIGDNPKNLEDNLKKANVFNKGYKIHLICAYCSYERSLKNNLDRFDKTKKVNPKTYIRKNVQQSSFGCFW